MNVIRRRRTESWERRFAKPGAGRAVTMGANTFAVQILAAVPVTVKISAATYSVIILVAAPKLASLGLVLNRFFSNIEDLDIFVLDTTLILNITFYLTKTRFQRLRLQIWRHSASSPRPGHWRRRSGVVFLRAQQEGENFSQPRDFHLHPLVVEWSASLLSPRTAPFFLRLFATPSTSAIFPTRLKRKYCS